MVRPPAAADGPTLELGDHLGPSTRAQYARVWRWFRANHPDPLTDTAPVQAFLDRWPWRSLRHRVLRTLLARHVRPPLRGRPLRGRPLAAPPAGPRRGGGPGPPKEADADAWWRHVPRYLRGPVAAAAGDWPRWIRAYAAAVVGCNPLRSGRAQMYVAHVWRVLHDRLGRTAGTAADWVTLGRGDLAAAIVACHPAAPAQRRHCRIACNRFFQEAVYPGHPLAAQRLRLADRDLPPAADGAPAPGAPHPALALAHGDRARDHFTRAEMDAVLGRTDLPVRDRLLLRILAETGLRRRAVSWLTVDAVYDAAAGRALPVCRALEKGLHVRRFGLSAAASALLAAYVADHHPGPDRVPWLFPSPKDPGRPIAPATVNAVLLRACRRCGIRGRHLHSHAVRKFVVVSLMAEPANRIEDVAARGPARTKKKRRGPAAKWIGHRTVDVTYGTYWDLQAEDVARSMRIPWLTEAAA